MLEICIQTYDQNVQLILKSYLPVVYGTPLSTVQTHCQKNKKIKRADQILPEVYGTTLNINFGGEMGFVL
jgi:nitrate reductase beta subunit